MGIESNFEFILGLAFGAILYIGVNGMWIILKGLLSNDNS